VHLIDPHRRTGRVSAAAGSPAPAADASSPPRKPKKRGPFQLVPVILRAMVDRLAKTCPCQQKPPGTSRCLTAAGGEQRRSSYFNNHRVEGDPAIVSGMKSGDTS